VKPSSKLNSLRTIKSFVRRSGRITNSQRKAWNHYWSYYGIDIENDPNEFIELFNDTKKRIVLEIGFGDGDNLIATAINEPSSTVIGIEVYRSGIGHCLINAKKNNLKNLKIIYFDAVEVLNQYVPNNSVDAINIFFPDPWPKKRHRKRRLISDAFVLLLKSKLTNHGLVHICTDWPDYNEEILGLFKHIKGFEPVKNILKRTQTKYERKAIALGNVIYESAYRLVL
jgi:tRNA (guanine-N7-)-methyltransferase